MCPKKSERLFSCQFYIVYLTVQNHSLRLITKIKVYRAVVIPTLLYGAETWTLYRRQVRLLERFRQRCLRSILNIKWHDYVSNEDVLEEAQLPSVESILLKQQLRWAGHVTRMEDSRMPKAVLFGELKAGKRNRGAPKKRYKDQLKKQLSLADIPPVNSRPGSGTAVLQKSGTRTNSRNSFPWQTFRQTHGKTRPVTGSLGGQKSGKQAVSLKSRGAVP